MSATLTEALVQPVRNPFFNDIDRRTAPRHECTFEATSRPADAEQALSWGAVVNDISVGGVSVTLCYPFRLGTFLAIELQAPNGMLRTLMVRVVHVHDQRDGMWRLGCEFLKPLSDTELIV